MNEIEDVPVMYSITQMNFSEMTELFLNSGFSVVLTDDFAGANNVWEKYVILWHPDGLLATCESYMGNMINKAKVYYNYRHSTLGFPHNLISSGVMVGDVWTGFHDAVSGDATRGIVEALKNFRAEGEFLPVWVARPFMWLLTYMDNKVDGYDYEAINEGRISRLPEHVRNAITPS